MNITLNLSRSHLEAINSGLLLVPYGVAAPVVNEINRQIAAACLAPEPVPDAQLT